MTAPVDGVRRGPPFVVPLAAVVTGALGVATLLLAERHLGLEAFAPLAQLWTMWAISAAGLTFSFQQYAAVRPVGRRSLLPGGEAQRLGWFLILAGAVVFVVTGLARETIFQSTSLVWPAAAALLPIGTALNGVRRGQLARRHRPVALAGVIAGENAIRLLGTVVLVLTDAAAPWFAVALIAGFAVALGPARGRDDPQQPEDGDGFDTLGAAALAGFLAHALMFGSPLLLAAAGGSAADVSALFLVLTGVRVPFVVLQAVVPQLAVALATADDRRRTIRSARRVLVLVAVGGSIVAGALGVVLGDLVIGTVFGIRGDVDPAVYGLLSAASVLAATALVATVILVVEGRSQRIVVAWGLPAASVPVVALTGTAAETGSLAAWLLAAHATVTLLAVAPAHRGRAPDGQAHPHDGPDAAGPPEAARPDA